MKIVVRGGHNFLAKGASGLIDETTEDRKVKDAVVNYLKQAGHSVLDVTPGNMDSNSDLAYGVNKATNWGADLFVSIHFNKAYSSYNGAIGSEVCVYSKFDIAQRVVDKLGQLGFKNRGQKIRTGLYELRKTRCKAMIVETCFCEATEDVALYKKLGVSVIGKAIAEGICDKNINLTTEPQIKPAEEMYRVRKSWEDVRGQVGAFKGLNNAKECAKQHTQEGYKVFNSKGVVIYEPEINASVQVPTEQPKPSVKTENPKEPEVNKTSIVGTAVLTKGQMLKYLLDNNKEPKLTVSAEKLVSYFLEEGAAEGIRGDIAFCQAIKETGFFKFGGQVLPKQNNYSGIGATNNSPVGKGAWFKTAREGVRAQIQHLKAYASKDTLKEYCIDPRFNLVTRGIAPCWEDLNGKWAVPGEGYGESILKIYKKIKEVVVDPGEEENFKNDLLKEKDQEKDSLIKTVLKLLIDLLRKLLSK